MRESAVFNPVCMETWPRAQHCYFYSRIAKVGYSVTVDTDVTVMYRVMKEKGKKFNAAYLYASTRAANQFPEMRTASRPALSSGQPGSTGAEPVIGVWTYLDPVYAVFHDDDKTFSTMHTRYDEDFGIFYGNYESDMTEFGQVHGILSKGIPPENALIVSSMPWISFNNYSPVNFSGADSMLPILESGKLFESDGRMLMPFSVSAHHAATDGYHVAKFLERFSELCESAGDWG